MPDVGYTERTAAVIDGRVQFLEGAAQRYPMLINAENFEARVPLINPATGEVIEGQTTSFRDVMMGITALTRHDQLRRDAEAAAAQAAAEHAKADALAAAQAAADAAAQADTPPAAE